MKASDSGFSVLGHDVEAAMPQRVVAVLQSILISTQTLEIKYALRCIKTGELFSNLHLKLNTKSQLFLYSQFPSNAYVFFQLTLDQKQYIQRDRIQHSIICKHRVPTADTLIKQEKTDKC